MSALDTIRNFIFRRQYAYRTTFRNPLGEEVLNDLRLFCRADRTTFHENDRVHANLEGRREVWLRITEHLNLTPEDLYALSTGQAQRVTVPTTNDEDNL